MMNKDSGASLHIFLSGFHFHVVGSSQGDDWRPGAGGRAGSGPDGQKVLNLRLVDPGEVLGLCHAEHRFPIANFTCNGTESELILHLVLSLFAASLFFLGHEFGGLPLSYPRSPLLVCEGVGRREGGETERQRVIYI